MEVKKPQGEPVRDSHLLFLSHAGSDTAAARALAERIENTPEAREVGLKVWFDKKDLEPGKGWQAQLEQALDHDSTSFAVYVGSHGVINWVDSEVRVALSRARLDPNYPFIPILSRQCSGSESLPAFARQYQGVVDVEGNGAEFAKLIRAAARRERHTPVRLVEEPFRGLRAFEEEHAALFFGRDNETNELVERLKRSRLLMLVGDSGSGKSSLVKAGLVPRYRGGALVERHDPRSEGNIWHVVETRPRSNPFDSLADSVAAAARVLGRGQEDIRTLRGMVRDQDPQEVADALRDGAPDNAQILVVIDQFEELFTLSDNSFRRRYIETILHLARHDSPATFRIVLTMRRDYYNLCHEYSELYGWLEDNQRGAKFSVRRMSDAKLRTCIEGPLAMAGIGDTGIFVNRVLADVGDQPGELALLEMALTESWQRRGAFGGDLLKAYTSIGGTAGALANVAEEVFNKLDEIEKELAKASLIRLVKLGETGGTTRRVATRDEFSEDAWRVLQKLARQDFGRLVYIGGQSPDGAAYEVAQRVPGDSTDSKDLQQMVETAELSHEALVSQWPRYQQWLQASPGEKRVHDGLMSMAKSWATATRKKKTEELLTGNRLAEGIALLEKHSSWLSDEERSYLEASRARAAWRNRAEKGTLVLLALLLVVAVWFAFSATEAKKLAQKQLQQATILRLAIEGPEIVTQTRAGSTLQGVLLARVAHRYQVGGEAYSGLLLIRDYLRQTSRILDIGVFVSTVAFSPDGKRIVSGSDDDTLQLWDASTGNPIGEPLKGHTKPVRSVAFSPDNKRIVSGSDDNTLRLWDASTGQPIGEPLKGHTSVVRSVAFSPDNKRIVSGSDDNTLRLWDASTGQPIGEPLKGHTSVVRSVAFSPDNKRIVSGSADIRLRLWDASTGKPIGEPLKGHTYWVLSVAFSPDGKRIVSGSADITLRLWDVSTGKPIGEPLKGHTNSVSSVAFSPDNKRIVSGSDDNTLRLWDASTGKPIGEPLKGHTNSVSNVAFSPDNKRIVSASFDNTLRLWDASTDNPIGEPLKGHTNAVESVAFSPDGKRIVSGSRDDTLRLWDASTGNPIGEPLKGHTNSVKSVAFSPDNKRIVSGSDDDTLRLWDVSTGKPIGEPLKGHTNSVSSVAFSPDNKRIVSGSDDDTLRLWDASTGNPIGEPLKGHTSMVRSVAFSPDGKRIVSGSFANTVRLWDASTGKPIGEPLKRHTDSVSDAFSLVTSVAFSPDGKRIISGGSDSTLRLWNASTGNPIGDPLKGHTNSVKSVAFSPDSKRIVSGSDDNTLRLWDASTGNPIGDPLKGHTYSVLSVAFSPDGKLIVSGGEDNILRRWPTPEALNAEVCAKLLGNMTKEDWKIWVGDIPYRRQCPELPGPPDDP